MRVVLSTISKFHTFDLARQMERHGVLERVFTGRPRWKMKGERLPPHKVSTFPYLQTVFEGLPRVGLGTYPLKTELNWLCHQTLDAYVARHLPACDVFHALSYCGLRSGETAQQRGAKWVCDAVNSHAFFQDEILAQEHDRVGLAYKRQDSRFLDYAAASYRQADMITVLSNFARRTFVEKGITGEKLAVVPYGVDVGEFCPDGIPREDGFCVLFVGQLSVRKGIHDLLEAFKIASLPRSQLIFVGSVQPETSFLLKRTPDVAPRIAGAQQKKNLRRFYSQADVMVVPSIEDGFGSVMVEAMACGCPVIATEHTGIRDCLSDGVEGFVVPIRSPESIAEKLVHLYKDSEMRRSMRNAALARVRSIRGWDSYGDQMLGVYRSVLGLLRSRDSSQETVSCGI